MEVKEIINLVISVLTLGSLIFAAYHFFKNPQISLEKKQALNEERDKNKASITNLEVLKTNFDLMCKVNEDKFVKIEKQVIDAFAIANNHTNTVDTKVDKLIERQDGVENKLVRLSTIIEERIPKKV